MIEKACIILRNPCIACHNEKNIDRNMNIKSTFGKGSERNEEHAVGNQR